MQKEALELTKNLYSKIQLAGLIKSAECLSASNPAVDDEFSRDGKICLLKKIPLGLIAENLNALFGVRNLRADGQKIHSISTLMRADSIAFNFILLISHACYVRKQFIWNGVDTSSAE